VIHKTRGDAVVAGYPREAMRAAAAYVLLLAHLIQVRPHHRLRFTTNCCEVCLFLRPTIIRRLLSDKQIAAGFGPVRLHG
jgi:hypothetical protein